MKQTKASIDSSPQSIGSAMRWSTLAEVSAKVMVPLTNMILARIITPEAFGIIASINLVISFADMLTTAGFNRYIIQHDFPDRKSLVRGMDVAFWTNSSLSILFTLIIALFRGEFAAFVGSPGYGVPLMVASLSLPLTSFSSIQVAYAQRTMQFRRLFLNRILAAVTPFIVTVPLALLGWGYWALIVGTIAGYSVQAVNLTIASDWKPHFFYSFSLLREMFSFSFWTLLESLALWLTTWVDVFIVSNVLGSYYSGLYRTTQTIVTGIISIITASAVSVLFPVLSRLQNDKPAFQQRLIQFQNGVALILLPLAIGIFVYRKWVTLILLGPQWEEASLFLGLWGFSNALVATYGRFCLEAYRSQGMPRISVFAQTIHLLFVIPLCVWATQQGFDVLIWVRSLAYMQLIVVHFVFLKIYIKIPPWALIRGTIVPILCSLMMGVFALLIDPWVSSLLRAIGAIICCMMLYALLLLCFPSMRGVIIQAVIKVQASLKKRCNK